MLIDSTGLGYSIRGGEILVHYPTRLLEETQDDDGAPVNLQRYEAGWSIGPVPAAYSVDPPNAITAERVRLWTELRENRRSSEG